MELFFQATSVVAAFVLAVMVLTLFFKFLAWAGGRSAKDEPRGVSLHGVLGDRTRATFRLKDGTLLADARLIGFTPNAAFKGRYPFSLQEMVVLELADGSRALFRAESIEMFEIPAKNVGPDPGGPP